MFLAGLKAGSEDREKGPFRWLFRGEPHIKKLSKTSNFCKALIANIDMGPILSGPE